jgi:focal adhesion kinase 1
LKEQFFNDEKEDFDFSVAIRLACLEMRKMYKDMHSVALEKKSNFDNIHLDKLIPKSVYNRTKTKLLRKHIQQIFRVFSDYSVDKCALEFCKELASVKCFTRESFHCDIGSSPAIPAEVVVGPDCGIGFRRSPTEPVSSESLYQE